MATGGKTDFDYVVIGSGFGGSVAALRLSEAGQSVPVLERGRGYSPGDFPRDITDTGRDNAGGQLFLRRGQLEIDWDYARQNQALLARMQTAMEEVAKFYGGRFTPLFSWSLFSRILTVHSLGGCNLSDTPDRGVVSPRGAVHGHPGLYVADGSMIPTAIGFHPCMTIAAVAEHIAEGLAREQ